VPVRQVRVPEVPVRARHLKHLRSP